MDGLTLIFAKAKINKRSLKKGDRKMSYAIIRNEKYTKDEMNQLSPHNERYKKKYLNKNIDLSKTSQNYHLKKPIENTYVKEFNRLVKQNNLYQSKKRANIIYACEMIITSDTSFFDKIGQKETKRYLQESYNFVCQYQGLGEENIISAVVHMDEETPHMHLVFIPVMDGVNKNGENCRKISSKEFWKDKNSYKKLQDSFYKYITEKGFDLERGKYNEDNPHRKMEDLKQITNFYDTKALKSNLRDVKDEMINYSDIQDFYKYEDFTKDNVDKKLIDPMMKYIQKLIKQNNDVLVELSKSKNARNYYSTLEEQVVETKRKNKELQYKLKLKDIELDACYGVIKEELEKNEKMQKIIKEHLNSKYGKRIYKNQIHDIIL